MWGVFALPLKTEVSADEMNTSTCNAAVSACEKSGDCFCGMALPEKMVGSKSRRTPLHAVPH